MQQVANLLQMPGVAEMAQQMSAIYPQMPGPVTGAQTVSRQMAGPVTGVQTGVQTGEQTGEQMSQMSAGFPQMAGTVRGEQMSTVSRQMAGTVTGAPQTGVQTGEQMSQMSAGFPQMAGAVRGEQTAAVPTAMPMMHSTMPAAMMMPAMMPASLQLPQTAATLPQPARSEVQVASVDILENTLSSYQLDPNISIPVDIQNIASPPPDFMDSCDLDRLVPTPPSSEDMEDDGQDIDDEDTRQELLPIITPPSSEPDREVDENGRIIFPERPKPQLLVDTSCSADLSALQEDEEDTEVSFRFETSTPAAASRRETRQTSAANADQPDKRELTNRWNLWKTKELNKYAKELKAKRRGSTQIKCNNCPRWLKPELYISHKTKPQYGCKGQHPWFKLKVFIEQNK